MFLSSGSLSGGWRFVWRTCGMIEGGSGCCKGGDRMTGGGSRG